VPTAEEIVRVYYKLADEHRKRDRPQERDRFMMLAADAAYTSGHKDDAEKLRRKILSENPHHFLKPYANLAEAFKSPDVNAYVSQLRTSYPFDKAQQLLREMRGEGDREAGQNGGRRDDEFVVPLDADRGAAPVQFAIDKPRDGAGDREVQVMTERPRIERPAMSPQPLPGLRPGPATGPGVFAVRQEPEPRRVAEPLAARTPRSEPNGGAWVGTLLFVLLLLAALAGLVLAFGMPWIRPML
jgi:hypothetical protein